MSRLRRVAAVAGALALPVAAMAELGGELAIAARSPTPEEWAAALAEARRGVDPDRPLIVAPGWAEPHARAGLGDDVMPLAHVARPDTDRFAGAVELGLRGARAPELDGFRVVEEVSIGPFVVRRLDNPAADPVRWDLVDHFRPPWASVLGRNPSRACHWNPRANPLSGGLAGHPTFPRERFDCPGSPYAGAGVTVITDQAFRPRRCIWAHPFSAGEKVLRFEDVPLEGATRLVGHHGMYSIVERLPGGADTELQVRLDEVPIGSATHRDGDGWSRFEIALPAPPPGAPADRRGVLELVISTQDDEHRHLCVEASLR